MVLGLGIRLSFKPNNLNYKVYGLVRSLNHLNQETCLAAEIIDRVLKKSKC